MKTWAIKSCGIFGYKEVIHKVQNKTSGRIMKMKFQKFLNFHKVLKNYVEKY